ncbi:MAG: TfoX/Sxy family protein [Methylophilaceae bacterium]
METCPGCGVAHAQPSGDAGIEQLHNLGPTSTAWMKQAGINTVAELSALGAVAAFLQVEALGIKPSLNLLYALEGAITGKHWLEVKRHSKTALLITLDAAREPVAT